MPPHYGSTTEYPRKICNETPLEDRQCAKCGYDKHPEILEVHHIDNKRSNNDLSNLEFLCPNCHGEHHFLTSTGKWAPRSVK